MIYKYGMRLRGFSIGCQPMAGLIDWTDTSAGPYYSELTYKRQLTDEEVRDYELDFITQEEER